MRARRLRPHLYLVGLALGMGLNSARATAQTASPAVEAEANCDKARAPAPGRVLGSSDPAAARLAENRILAHHERCQAPNDETDEAKHAREAQAAEVWKLANAAKIEAFDPALFELARQAAERNLVAAKERLKVAQRAWNRPPATDEKPAVKQAFDAAQAAHDRAVQAKESADEAVSKAAAAAALLEVQQQRLQTALAEADATKRDALVQQIDATKTEIDDLKVDAFDAWLAARGELAPSAERQLEEALADAENAAGAARVLSNGARLSWGVTGSLLRFRTERAASLPGGYRNYRPRFEFVPGEAGFQFLSEPDGLPWRLQLKDGGSVQVISWGGILLAGIGEDSEVERGNLSLAATLAFFENTIGLGAGFDLYRGIPVRGADGTPGGDTAFTGVLAWALAPEGEVTAENAFVVVTVNLSTLIDAVSNTREED